nr:MAG TPA: alpha-S2-casein peptide [Caudoviricetes sp.]
MILKHEGKSLVLLTFLIYIYEQKVFWPHY